MGTSRNDHSPRTPPWKPIREILGNPKVPIITQSHEIWRAAASDREGRLIMDLSNKCIAQGLAIAATSDSPIQAAKSFESLVGESGSSSFFVDIAKRALLRAVAKKQGPNGFAAEVFAETASYYVSRDLAGVVGNPQKVKTTSEGIEIKDRLRQLAKTTATTIAEKLNSQGQSIQNEQNWNTFVLRTVSALKGKN